MNKKIPNKVFPLLIYLFRPFKWHILGLVILCIFFGTISAIAAYFLEVIINFVSDHEKINNSDFLKTIIKYGILYGLWWESINIASRLYDFLYMRSLPNIKARVFNKFYSNIQNNSNEFFHKNLAGFVSNRIAEASKSVEMIFSIINEKIIVKSVAIISAIIGLYLIHQIFATIFVIWLVIFIFLTTFWSPRIKNLSSTWAMSRSLISGKIVDNISNISSIRIFNNYKYEDKYITHYVNKMVKNEYKLQWFMLRIRYILGLSCSLMIFSMIYYLGLMKYNLIISAGAFAFVLSISNDITSLLWDFGQEFGDLFEEIGTLNQSLEILSSQKVKDKNDADEIIIQNGKIEFKNVSFSYIYNNNLFKNQNIIINGGEKIGLVGYSGSGKTTFVNLITRLYDIDEGQILIDNIDISNVTQKSLRKNISIIPQEPILFNRSVFENIRYGDMNANFEQVIEASKKAYIHEEILKLSEGYETICGERGRILSGGQRQRIIIARAILKNAPILILDEATSSLDSLTEEYIQKSLDHLMINKTVLIIAHRLTTLKSVDRILVFEKGHIVQKGKHTDLLSQGGLYLKLWQSQIAGYLNENPELIV